jgi:ketosteroid isomerase-like protein
LLVCAKSDNPDLHHAIQDQETKMAMAMNSGNATLFASYYDPKAHFMQAGDEDLVGRDAIAAAVQGLLDSGVKSVNFTALEVDFIHKYPVGWAYERGSYFMYNGDGSVFDQGYYVVVWNRPRDQHQWLAYYDIPVSSLPATASVNQLQSTVKTQALVPATPRRPRAPATPQGDKLLDAITGANLVIMSAYDSGDAGGVAACYELNATVLPNHSDPVVGTEAIQLFFQGAMNSGIAEIELTIVEVNYSYDDGVAYEKSTYIFRDENGNITDIGKYIVIWRHLDGDTYKVYIDCFNSDKQT